MKLDVSWQSTMQRRAAAHDALAMPRRLNETVRGGALPGWGGEALLMLAPQVPAEQVERLTERVLRFVGEQPVRVRGQPVRVTVSIGDVRFPLPPNTLPVAWERATTGWWASLRRAPKTGPNCAASMATSTAPRTRACCGRPAAAAGCGGGVRPPKPAPAAPCRGTARSRCVPHPGGRTSRAGSRCRRPAGSCVPRRCRAAPPSACRPC